MASTESTSVMGRFILIVICGEASDCLGIRNDLLQRFGASSLYFSSARKISRRWRILMALQSPVADCWLSIMHCA